jgi:hypothetical protein
VVATPRKITLKVCKVKMDDVNEIFALPLL